MWDNRGDGFDRIMEALLAILLLFMPLAFGAVEAWSELLVLALVAAMSACFVLKTLAVRRTLPIRTWAYVPVVGYLVVAAVQLIPLPAGWVRLISPNTVALRRELLGDLRGGEDVLSRMTLSFYPHATWHDLRLMLAGAAVFVIVLNVYQRPDQIMRLLWVIVAIAGGIAILALICVLYIGFNAAYDRLAPLDDLPKAQADRWQILKDVAEAWSRFPVLGTGAGTHEVVYPTFDRSVVPKLAGHAQNEYAQAVEETGILELIALAVFGVIVWFSYVRATEISDVPLYPAAYGLGFGLMAVLVHSLSDFGPQIPANAFLSAVFCALLIRLAHADPGRQSGSDGMVSAAEMESDQVRGIDRRVREPLWRMCRRPQRGVSVL